jgi:hypothetical protein
MMEQVEHLEQKNGVGAGGAVFGLWYRKLKMEQVEEVFRNGMKKRRLSISTSIWTIGQLN